RVANRIETEDAHRAGRCAQQPEEMLEERRLASAVGADEPVDLAGGSAEGHAVERAFAAERSREVTDIDNCCLSHLYLSSSSSLLLLAFRRFGVGLGVHGRLPFAEHP